MRCSYCQSEIENGLSKCPVCGAPTGVEEVKAPDYFSQNQSVPEAQSVNQFVPDAQPAINPLHAKTDMLVKDNLYLAVCVLHTVATALPLFSDIKAFNIIGVIIAVFLWIIYAESKKGLPNPARIRIISGSVYATSVVLYVIGAIVALMGILCFFSTKSWVGLFTDAFSKNAVITNDLERIFSMGGWLIGICFLIAAGIIIILNYFSYGKIHKFVKSCYENIQNGVNALENRNITSVWLIVFAVIMGIAALGSIFDSPVTSVSFGCQTATCIISHMLLKKYYIEYN